MPSESGYAAPDEPTQPPSSHTATFDQAARTVAVHTGPSGGVAGGTVDAGGSEMVLADGAGGIVVGTGAGKVMTGAVVVVLDEISGGDLAQGV